MSTLQSTLRLYRDSASDTVAALPRSASGLLALLLGGVAMVAGAALFGPLGLAGGFMLGLLNAGVAGFYLSVVEQVVTRRRAVPVPELGEHAGNYLWEVISVMFIFFIAGLLLSPLLPAEVLVVLAIGVTILFNPAPEMIYQDHARSLPLLGDAVKFMQFNWPEWLGAHLVAAGVLAGVYVLLGREAGLMTVFELLQIFGPWFGFTTSGITVLGLAQGPAGILLALLLLGFIHTFMLFRGFLYHRMRYTSARSRAWQSRM